MNAAVHDDRGFSLTEVLIAMVVAVIAVLGLAHTFGSGRALITSYETARAASALVEGRVEALASLAARSPLDPALTVGTHGPTSVALSNDQTGSESWLVQWVDDPINGSSNDYTRVTVTITWMDGQASISEQRTRTLRAP